jgi:hypothetical protein
MLELIGLGMSAGAAIAGYVGSRSFVRNRLRFVDAVHGKAVPWIAGATAAAVAAPVVWVLPLVGAGTALLFGASVGVGVSRGAKDARGVGGYELGP